MHASHSSGVARQALPTRCHALASKIPFSQTPFHGTPFSRILPAQTRFLETPSLQTPALGALLLTLALAGCADPSTIPSLEPVYEGCATDENWVDLDQLASASPGSETPTSPESTPTWMAPSAGAELDSQRPVLFRFAAQPEEAVSDSGDAVCPQYQPRGLSSRHLPAVTGTLCDLRFARDGQPLHRVLTTRRVTSLPRSLWQAMAGSWLGVSLLCVRLQKNQISAGPYHAPSRQFFVR